MIRVLHIVTYMDRGGLETMLMNYYRHMDRQQVQFDFLVHRDFQADYDAEILALGGKIYRFPRLVPWSPGYRKKLTAFFRDHPEYRIVHVHQDCLSAVALECAKNAGVPVRIAHSHSSSQDKNLKYLIKLWYRRFIPRYATDLLACGREAGDWMFSGAAYQILNNAIDTQLYGFDPALRAQVRRDLGLGEDFTLGLTARFAPAKNHEFLLEVFARVCDRLPRARLLLVGDGPLRQDLERKIRDLGLQDRVILTGVRTDVPALLQAMDAFVMPSRYEGLGLAVVEAQAAGLPCFISNFVPIECKKTDLVRQLPLDASPETWAEEILKARGNVRPQTGSQIAVAGFDIHTNAQNLQEFYLNRG